MNDKKNPDYDEFHAEDMIDHCDGPTATPEEQAAHEQEMNDPEYIYNIRGRIANHVAGRATLTPMGDKLCNMMAHVLKDFYTFAACMDNPGEAENLRDIIRKHEQMPADLISLQPRKM